MKKRAVFLSIFILLVFTSCAPQAVIPTQPISENIEEYEQLTLGLIDPVEPTENMDYLFPQDRGGGKYININGTFEKLDASSEAYFTPSDISNFVLENQPIISIIRISVSEISLGIPVKIVDCFGVSQPATVLFDDGERIALQPNNPLKDGMYFVIDDYSSGSGDNLHFINYFFIWQNRNEELANIGEFLTGVYSDPPSRSTFYYFDQVSLNAISPPITNLSEDQLFSIPIIKEGALAFIHNSQSDWDVEFVRYSARGWEDIGINASGDNCHIWEIDELGIRNGFLLNDEILAVNDVERFADDNRTACWALEDFLKYQTLGRSLSITVKRGGEEIVLDNIEFNLSKFPADKWLQTMGKISERVRLYQTQAPLLDGIYCIYELFSPEDVWYCFWKQ